MTKNKRKFTMDKATLIRTIVLVIALANNGLVAFGLSPFPFTHAEVEAGLSVLFTTLATMWAWHKNNSITPEARQADVLMRELKAKSKRKDDDK